MSRKFILNELGQATTIALVAVAVTTTAVLLMMDRIVNVEKDLRYPRVKAQQTIQKVRLTTALNSPRLYTGCRTVSQAQTNSTSDTQTCVLDLTVLSGIITPVKGADCDSPYPAVTNEILPSGGCGFSIRPTATTVPIWDPDTLKFRGLLHYMGKETVIADTLIEFNVPGQLLTGEITVCPATAPQFQGFNPTTGDAICTPFDLTPQCPAGQFVSSVDPITFRAVCNDYTQSINCPSSQFLSNLSFSGGKYTGGCTDRINPFVHYNYNPDKSVVLTAFTGPSTGIVLSAGRDYSWYAVAFTSPPLVPPPANTCPATGPGL